MSNQETTPQPAQPAVQAKKPRSKVELAIVWGGIGVMLVLVGLQGSAYLGYNRTLTPLQQAVKSSDESESHVTLSMVQGMIQGNPQFAPGTHVNGERRDVYTWKGLFRSYTIEVTYGIKGIGKMGGEEEVMNIATN
jgi:hypothetical protein